MIDVTTWPWWRAVLGYTSQRRGHKGIGAIEFQAPNYDAAESFASRQAEALFGGNTMEIYYDVTPIERAS